MSVKGTAITIVAAEVQAQHPDWPALECWDLANKVLDQDPALLASLAYHVTNECQGVSV